MTMVHVCDTSTPLTVAYGTTVYDKPAKNTNCCQQKVKEIIQSLMRTLPATLPPNNISQDVEQLLFKYECICPKRLRSWLHGHTETHNTYRCTSSCTWSVMPPTLDPPAVYRLRRWEDVTSRSHWTSKKQVGFKRLSGQENYGSLRFAIIFRRVNCLTKVDSYR